MQSLGVLPGGSSSLGTDISADGSTVAGYAARQFSGESAFRWTSAGGMQDLGTLAGALSSYGNGISGDGSVVVGFSGQSFNSARRAFRWTNTGGMQGLGFLPGGSTSSADAVNGDGSIVVGNGDNSVGAVHALLWTPALGAVDFNTYLPTVGVDLTGWTLQYASSVSADGSAITGTGLFNGQTRAFFVTGLPIPSPAPATLLGLSGLLAVRRRR